MDDGLENADNLLMNDFVNLVLILLTKGGLISL